VPISDRPQWAAVSCLLGLANSLRSDRRSCNARRKGEPGEKRNDVEPDQGLWRDRWLGDKAPPKPGRRRLEAYAGEKGQGKGPPRAAPKTGGVGA